MKLTKVVILNDTAIARGGAAALAVASAQAFRKRGIAVNWLSGDDGQNEALAHAGVALTGSGGVELLKRGRLDAMRSGIRNRDAEHMVADAVRRLDDPGTIYHVHAWSQILSPAVFRALRPVAPRTYLHAHDFFAACPNGVFYNFRTGRACDLRPLSAACVLSQCDKRSYAQKLWRVARHRALAAHFGRFDDWAGVIAIHPKQAERLIRAGIDEHLLKLARNPVRRYSDSRIPAENNQGLVFVGRIEPDKGVMELAEAARATSMPLTLIGEGPLVGELTRSHPEIRQSGWQDRAGIAQIVATARALVMPSRFPEPFGMVAAEASESGLPVIVADDAYLAADITAHGLGLSTDIHDPAAFAATLAQMRDMPSTAVRRMSEAGFARSARLASTGTDWAERLLALYDEALANSAA